MVVFVEWLDLQSGRIVYSTAQISLCKTTASTKISARLPWAEKTATCTGELGSPSVFGKPRSNWCFELALEDPVHSVSLQQYVYEKLKAQQALMGDQGFGALMETVDTEIVRQLQEFLQGL